MGATKSPRFSGLQKQVLSLYRDFLRAEDRRRIESVVSAEFRRNSNFVDRKNFLYIEYLLRRGRNRLDLTNSICHFVFCAAYLLLERGHVIRGIGPPCLMNIGANLSISATFSPLPLKFGGLNGADSITSKIWPAGGFKRRITDVVIMRDRSKNRKPLQRGRVSTEAIQTVQALIRGAKRCDCQSLQQAMDSKFKRLLKFDMIAVLHDLIRQNESFLALKVFEDVRKEHWYKPRLLLYADMALMLGNNGLLDEVKQLLITLKMEPNLEADIQGFNVLLRALLTSDVPIELAMECYGLMKQSGREPDRESFRILINALELKGEKNLSSFVQEEARMYFGDSFEFFEEREQLMGS